MSEDRTMTLTSPTYEDGQPVSRSEALAAAFLEVARTSRMDVTIRAAWLRLPDGEMVNLSNAIDGADAPPN